MSTYTEELSSCEYASNFYLDVLKKMIESCTAEKISSMNLDIDRGVTNFSDFKHILSYGFGYLKELNISQNYTSNNYNDKENYEHFKSFLKKLKLIKFNFIDDQSTFTKLIAVDDIFEIMPANAVYKFKLGNVDDIKKVVHHKRNKCIKWSYNSY